MGVSENGVYGIPLKWLFQWQTDDESLNSGVPYFQTKAITIEISAASFDI
jgi:hypothetical protein